MHGNANQCAETHARSQQDRLAHAGSRRFQNRAHRSTGGKAQPVYIDHLLAHRNDKRHPERGPAHRGQDHVQELEIRTAKVEYRDSENDPCARVIDRAGHGLVDIVLDNRAPPEDAS